MLDDSRPLSDSATDSSTALGDGRSDRSPRRALGTAFIAAGVAVSAFMYPVPGKPDFFDLSLSPAIDQFGSWNTSELVESASFRRVLIDAASLALPDLVKLAELSDGALNLDIPAATLLDMVESYGLRNVVEALEVVQFLASTGILAPKISLVTGGGGGGGGASIITPRLWSDLIALFELLMQNFGQLPGNQLSAVIANVLPALARSLSLPQVAAPPSLAQLSKLVQQSIPAPAPAPVVAPSLASAWTFSQLTTPAGPAAASYPEPAVSLAPAAPAFEALEPVQTAAPTPAYVPKTPVSFHTEAPPPPVPERPSPPAEPFRPHSPVADPPPHAHPGPDGDEGGAPYGSSGNKSGRSSAPAAASDGNSSNGPSNNSNNHSSGGSGKSSGDG